MNQLESSQNFEPKNKNSEKNFDDKMMKNLLSKVLNLSESDIQSLNEYTGYKYNKSQNYFDMGDSHQRDLNAFRKILDYKNKKAARKNIFERNI